MAARRAKAKEEAPPPPPEPVPEPEPEKLEEPAITTEPEQADAKSTIDKDGKVTEKIIERIIICPGMQGPCGGGMGMMGPPGGYNPMINQQDQQQPPGPHACPSCPSCVINMCCKKKKDEKKRKKKNKNGDCDEPCKHKFCIVERAKIRPQGLPWASGLWPGPPPRPPPPPPRPVVVCQRPVLCSGLCGPPPRCHCDDDDGEDKKKNDLCAFMNLVFSASNIINERRDVF